MNETQFRRSLRQFIWLLDYTYIGTWDLMLTSAWSFWDYAVRNELYVSPAAAATHTNTIVEEELVGYIELIFGAPTPDTITVTMLEDWFETYNV